MNAELVEESKSVEARMDARRWRKKLVDCALPEGMRLQTLEPRQYVMDGLLVWAFVLVFEMPARGDSEAVELFHLQRYWLDVADDVQMRWALREFAAKLETAGLDSGDARQFAEEMPGRNSPRVNGGAGGGRRRGAVGSDWMRGGFHSTGRRAVSVPA